MVESGLQRPGRIIEATSSLMVVRLLEETSCLAVMARDVAETFAGPGTVDVSISGIPSLVVPAGAEPRRVLSECLAG